MRVYQKVLLAGVASIVASSCATLTAAQADTVKATIDSGVLVGKTKGDVARYVGVPFAKPPVGELRWKPPQPTSWEGELEATEYKLPCYQETNPDGVTLNQGGVSGPSSEDCLYLNVYAPKDATGDAPVMVWFYGGGNVLGGGHLPSYDGQSFAENGVVVVSINYRLGAAGWFGHPALTAEAEEGAPLVSYGSMDQTEALRWVQRNIKAFGGDPENVTIFGQSAGGYGVYAQLASPQAKGLFHKAIVHSAGYTRPLASMADIEKRGAKKAKEWGLDGKKATAEELRAVPIEKLGRGIGAAVDGGYFTEQWMTSFSFNRHPDVPFIVGGNSGEGVIWAYDRWIAEQMADAGAPAFQYQFSHVRDGLDASKGAIHSAELRFAWNTLYDWAENEDNVNVANTMHPCWVAFAKYSGEGDIDCGNGVVWPAFSETKQPVVEFATQGAVVHEQYRTDEEWAAALEQGRR